MDKAISISNLILRHLIASVVSVAAPTLTLLIIYVVLFVIAIFTNSGLGSPIALPLWLIFIVLVSTFYTATLMFPSTLIAEGIASAFGKWRHLTQIPISTVVLLTLVYAFSLLARLHPDYSRLNIMHWADYPLIVFLVLAIPLGLYWWIMKIVQAGVSLPIIFLGRLRKQSPS